MTRTREAEPAHRLQTLLARLAAAPPDATAQRSWLAGRFILGPDASVELGTNDEHVIDVATRAWPYRSEPPGQSRWKVLVRSGFDGFDATDHASYAFAGANSVEVSQPIGPPLEARVLPTGDGGFAFWIADDTTLLHAQPHASTVRAYCASSAAGRHWAVRLVRNAMLAQLEGSGAAVWARAAACVVGGAGVLIAGSAGTGKTATLLACLLHLGGDFVADDRVLLRGVPDGLVGHAWPPASLTLPRDVVRAYPRLRQHLGAPDERLGVNEPVVVEQRDIALLGEGASCVDHVRPHLMLWPDLWLGSGYAPPPRWIHPRTVVSVLQGYRFFAQDTALEPPTAVEPPSADRFPVSAAGPTPSAGMPDVVGLLSRVPTFVVSVTRDPQELAFHITDLLRRYSARYDP